MRTSDSVILVESCPKISIEVRRLIVNGVVVGVKPLSFLKGHPTENFENYSEFQGFGQA